VRDPARVKLATVAGMLRVMALSAGLLLTLCGCAAESPPPPRSAMAALGAASLIGAMLDDFHAAAARADETAYFAHFTDQAVFLGTDATERWTKDQFLSYAHPRFASGTAWSFRALERHIDVDPDGRIAWFDESLTTGRLGPARGTGVVVKQGGRWRIAQYSLSITIPNESFPGVKELLEKKNPPPLLLQPATVH
jgi:ketosteroid isomerase-like protein